MKYINSWIYMFTSVCFFNVNKVFSMSLILFNFVYLAYKKAPKILFIIQTIICFVFLILISYFYFNDSFIFIGKTFNQIIGFDIRNEIAKFLDNIHSVQISNFIKLLILNIKNENNIDFYNNLKSLSLVHLIVVGGFHVNLICFLFYKIFFKFKKVGSFLSFIVALILCYLNNFSASTIRTVLFIFFGLFNITKKYKHQFSILAIFLIAPYAILNVGLCMSYACIRGLKFFEKLNITFNKFLSGIISSIFVSIYLIPFLSFLNGEFSLWSFFISTIFTPVFVVLYIFVFCFAWTSKIDIVFLFFYETIFWFSEILNLINVKINISFLCNQYVGLFYVGIIEFILFFVFLKREEKWRLEKYSKI